MFPPRLVARPEVPYCAAYPPKFPIDEVPILPVSWPPVIFPVPIPLPDRFEYCLKLLEPLWAW